MQAAFTATDNGAFALNIGYLTGFTLRDIAAGIISFS